MNAYTQQYQQNQILTASPEQILVMLYDAAIRFTRQAMNGIESGDRVQKLNGVSRAMAIITEFANTLDHSIGGEIAANLDALYAFMNNELTKANLNNDIEKLKVVETLFLDLRGTWVEAIEVARKENATHAQNTGQTTGNVSGQTAAKSELPANYRPLSSAG